MMIQYSKECCDPAHVRDMPNTDNKTIHHIPFAADGITEKKNQTFNPGFYTLDYIFIWIRTTSVS